MDPLTIVGAVASCTQLAEMTGKIFVHLFRYYRGVKQAPEKSKELTDELSELSSVLEDLTDTLQEVNSTCGDVVNDIIKARSLQKYSDFLRDFESRIQVDKKDLKKRVKWPFSAKENEESLLRIERYKATFAMALETANLKLTSINTYIYLHVKLSDNSVKLVNLSDDIKRQEIDGKRKEIINWLWPCDPSTNHTAAQSKHEPGTGNWFIDSEDFTDWKENKIRSLWLQGIPGAGKTILCSTIIQQIETFCTTHENYASAYFYFDFNDRQKQVVDSFLRSAIIQLFVRRRDIPADVMSLYSQSHGGQPGREALIVTLLSVFKLYARTYILIDAFDECSDRIDAVKVLQRLLNSSGSMNLLITSRKEQDIITALEPHVDVALSIQSAKVNADVAIHVRQCLDNDPALWRCESVKSEVVKALVDGADGMFRWVVCQLEALRKCLTVAAIRRALRQLPKTLDETYDRILANIDPDWQHYVYDILTLLAFSLRPVKLKEVVDAIALKAETGCFSNDEKLQDPLDILKIGSSLIILSKPAEAEEDELSEQVEEQELRFAHFSVKEYLVSDRTTRSQFHITEGSAHQLIAERCLLYLISNLDIPAFSRYDVQGLSFLEYSSEFWYQHSQEVTSGQDWNSLNDRMTEFFDDTARRCFSNWLTVWDPDTQNHWPKDPSFAEPLYYASSFGFINPVMNLLHRGADINAQGGFYGDAMQAAVYLGHESMVQLLLDRGADINAKGGYYENALHAAAAEGNETMVQLLLDRGADINAQGGVHGNALHAAAENGHEMMVQLLLDRGADINAQGGVYGNALYAAATEGNETIVRLLEERGATYC